MKTIELFPTKYISQNYHSPCIGIFGENTSCKNRIIKEIVQTHKFPTAVVFSSGFNLGELMERQLVLKRENFKRRELGEPENDIRVLLIIEGCLIDKNFHRLLIKNRHCDITIIITASYNECNKFPHIVRINLGYIFLMGEEFGKEMLENIYNKYGDSVHTPTYDSFSLEFGDVTTNGGALVLNKRYDGGRNHDEKIGGYWKEAV
jgi:hypothetical protein